MTLGVTAPPSDLRTALAHASRFEGVTIARGYFEAVTRRAGECVVHGWMLLPDQAFDSLQVYWNGDLVGAAEPVERPDVSKALPWIPHAGKSGFAVHLPARLTEGATVGLLVVLGSRDDRPLARMGTLFRPDTASGAPIPPAALIERVLGHPNSGYFVVSGLKSFTEFIGPIVKHADSQSARRILDWGCGCGRVSRHFLHFLPDLGGPEFYGCDIDGEAIAWCSEHLQPGIFTHIEPWPPTRYDEAMFDVVVGFSVFTHLSKKAQRAWLAEMRRIIAPGGLFLASTHGDCAACYRFRDEAVQALRRGISDEKGDTRCEGIAPPGYYRQVFQSREYTRREFAKHFDIVEYIERGMGNYQDLVVMRRP